MSIKRIPSGTTDQYVFFDAVDATDGTTRETGLSSFTVYRVRDTGSITAWSTPTIVEVSPSNMPGVYKLLVDEDTEIDFANDSEQMKIYITHTGMKPVSLDIELYKTASSAVASYDPPTHDEVVALFQCALRADAGIAADRSDTIDLINEDVAGGGAGTYSSLSDSQESFYNVFNERISVARAGYLDNLNIGEDVAGQSTVFSRSRATVFSGTGKTVYALIYDSSNNIYNGSTFETYNASNYSTSYARSVSETGSSGVYSIALPSGAYVVEFRQQMGSSPSTNDKRLNVMQA